MLDRFTSLLKADPREDVLDIMRVFEHSPEQYKLSMANYISYDRPEGNTLHCLVDRCNKNVVRRLVSYGADANYGCNDTYPIIIATKNCNIDAIVALLEVGANVNLTDEKGNTALHFAVKRGRVDIVKLLLSYNSTISKNKQEETPLHLAVKRNHRDIVEILLLTNPNLNVTNRMGEDIHCAIVKYKSVELATIIVNYLIRESFVTYIIFYEYSCLFASHGAHDSMEILLEHSRINNYDFLHQVNCSLSICGVGIPNPLQMTIYNHDTRLLMLLISYGASFSYISHSDDVSLIQDAVTAGYATGVMVALADGAKITEHLMFMAIEIGNYDVLEILIACGRPTSRYSYLEVARYQKRWDVIRLVSISRLDWDKYETPTLFDHLRHELRLQKIRKIVRDTRRVIMELRDKKNWRAIHQKHPKVFYSGLHKKNQIK
jgi:hypothetical protein